MRVNRWLIVAVAIASQPALAERISTDVPPPNPLAELAAMQVAEGYEVSLFASDPMISKPLQMNFDPQGRLWVSSSAIYPQIRPGEVADDTVTILEDRDGDGRADVATTFADGLLIPTAVLPDDRGGAYVANSTELVHFADTDGDGRADRRTVVLSGFGAEDTHHIIHTFRWGPDARFYFNQSIYIHSHVETPKGVRRLNGGGIWRFRPEMAEGVAGRTFALDVFARGWVNPWGHVFDRWGRSLVTDGAGGEGINYAFPGAAYRAAVGTPRVLRGMNPGSPKFCGLEIIDGGHLPADAQGLLVTNDFRANRVCRFRLTEKGSGFTSERLPDLIHSQRVTFRPIDVKMGPDGAIYIADWYNPIINHGEVDFRDERRDRTHGRIWRVTAKGRPLVPRIDFTKRKVPELLDHLRSSDGYVRDMARRELFARGGEAVVTALGGWIAALDRSDPEFERLRLEALRMKQGLDRGGAVDVDSALLSATLGSTDSRARAAACRVVADWAGRLENPVALLSPAVDDPAPQVRLEAVRALASIGGRRAAELVLHAVDHDLDNSLDYAVWLAARELRGDWLPAVIDGSFDDGGKLSRLVFAIRAAEAAEAIPAVMPRLRSGTENPAQRKAALDCIATLGGPDHLRWVFDIAVANTTPPDEAAPLLERLVETQERRRVRPAGSLASIAGLLQGPLVRQAIAAAGAWQVAEAVEPLAAIAMNEAASVDRRQEAISVIGRIPGDASRRVLERLAANPVDAIAVSAVAAMSASATDAAAAVAVPLLSRPLDPANQSAVFVAFLSVKNGAERLAAAIETAASPLRGDVVRRGLEAVSASGRREPALEKALEATAARGGSTGSTTAAEVSANRTMKPEEFEAFVTVVRDRADAKRGEAIYTRESLRCTSCHRVGNRGGRVGPNLAAIGASSPLDYIIDSVVNPAKNVKEGYNTVVVLTTDGRVVAGIPVSRSDSQLVLRDATDKEVRIATADIDEESPGTSLMPAGLVDGLSREELADLIRYLSELGR